jgi:hypothetical protein
MIANWRAPSCASAASDFRTNWLLPVDEVEQALRMPVEISININNLLALRMVCLTSGNGRIIAESGPLPFVLRHRIT